MVLCKLEKYVMVLTVMTSTYVRTYTITYIRTYIHTIIATEFSKNLLSSEINILINFEAL